MIIWADFPSAQLILIDYTRVKLCEGKTWRVILRDECDKIYIYSPFCMEEYYIVLIRHMFIGISEELTSKLCSLFGPKYGGNTFLRNVRGFLSIYTLLYLTKIALFMIVATTIAKPMFPCCFSVSNMSFPSTEPFCNSSIILLTFIYTENSETDETTQLCSFIT